MFEHVQARPPRRFGDDRPIRPPRPVWVDLPAMFGPGQTRYPAGWDTQHHAEGELHAWARSTTGEWIALVRYRLHRGTDGGGMLLTHWLPAHLVTPRGTDATSPTLRT